MSLVYIFGFAVMFYAFVPFRLAVLHPFKTVYNAVVDLYFYFRHLEFNFYEAGVLNCYCAHFGGGKTLSIVHYVNTLFARYNNKKVWDRGRRKFVTQKIHILSNVDLKAVPFEPLTSLSQIVNCAKVDKDIDNENDTRTVVLVVLDEASVQLNSRAFKTNIDPIFLNTLLTSRHYHISFLYSSQKFKLTDALMRSVTQKCINCRKLWRFMVQSEYDADEMEYASDPTMLKPRRRTGFFITNRDYESYDTLACVDNLKKSIDDGDMMSEEEILALRGDINPDNDNVSRRSFKLKKRMKRK
ncbi:MAG: hypothetical protein NC131_21140 [Roseburia sp.]|nr:hypothetical protein [Roseburia sp.]